MLKRTPPTDDIVPVGEEVLPGYRVVRLLAHGRRIDTYDVYSVERDCRCVVKRLRPDRTDEARVWEATLAEGRLLRDLAHPHLVRAYEVVEAPLPAMVLETLPGATLAALIEESPLSVSDLAELGLHLVSALGYLHRHDWLHLDVKPDNVIVTESRAVLIDLSLAGRPGDGRPGAGTRGYLSPEQARGTGLSAASDVWGLAVTLAEGVTGDLVHGDEATWDSRGRSLLHRRLPTPELAEVPEPLRTLLGRCLTVEPDRRPTLSEVRSELKALTA